MKPSSKALVLLALRSTLSVLSVIGLIAQWREFLTEKKS